MTFAKKEKEKQENIRIRKGKKPDYQCIVGRREFPMF